MKSFLLSLSLTILIAYFFMSIFEKNTPAFITKMPEKLFIVCIVVALAGYLLAAVWALKGIFKGSLFFNLAGLLLSILGIAIFIIAYQMEKGQGRESAGQFDHLLSKIETNQYNALQALLEETATRQEDIKMIAYWNMSKNPDSFSICIQRGNIIALQVKDKTIRDLNNISPFSKLNWLVLKNCQLKSIAALNLPLLQRLDVQNNQLTSLDGLQHSPEVEWLNFQENPVTDSAALKSLLHKDLYIVSNK